MPAKKGSSKKGKSAKIEPKRAGKRKDRDEDEEDVESGIDPDDADAIYESDASSELIYEGSTEEEYDSDEAREAKLERKRKKLEEYQKLQEAEGNMDDDGPQPLLARAKPGEKGRIDSKAYSMLHTLTVGWPCLSFDVLLDKKGYGRNKYPHQCMVVTGSQAEKADDCEIILKHVSHLCKTKRDKDDDDSSSDEDGDDGEESDDSGSDEDDSDPILFSKHAPHSGAVNRIRSMKQHPGIIASWNEEGHISAFDLRHLVLALDDPKAYAAEQAANYKKKPPGKGPFFKSPNSTHKTEGFALEWSPRVEGWLASGDCNGKLFFWQKEENGTGFTSTVLNGHTDSVEDIQWSPAQDNVLATCSVDCSVKVWDVRDPSPQKMSWQADVVDINVLSWNTNTMARQFLATGADNGGFKVWDLRMVKRADVTPISEFNFHTGPITSIEWSPISDSVLAASSPEMVTFWDFSVERDDEQDKQMDGMPEDEKVPPQLMFVHQGVEEVKEIHWHPQIPGMLIITSLDGFQFIKPMNWLSLTK